MTERSKNPINPAFPKNIVWSMNRNMFSFGLNFNGWGLAGFDNPVGIF